MTGAMATLLAASSSSTSSSSGGSSTFLIFLVLIGVAGYFFLIRPQKQKQKRQRQQQSEVSVGDEILTVGGIVGRVVAVEPDRITVLSGSDTVGFPAAGSEPTRLVFVRSAVARKLEPTIVSDAEEDEDDGDAEDGDGADGDAVAMNGSGLGLADTADDGDGDHTEAPMRGVEGEGAGS